ncbi:hypothetical protein N7533_010894 [Penicillium manginii]|uniref:uncharacterized protein n=1 Tax=Penicillium manginii TaxID=203109 RepID=UPI002547BE8D|nr:uncharacterized protein N7533_010894 [Penicillium manginii]KAJ5741485.1 hypothetical protein N7533_010894 [Penicillium manginii]
MIAATKRKVLDGLNRRYIYGRVPLLHTIIFLIEMAVATRIAAKFNTYYAEKPGMTWPFALCPVLFPGGLSANMSALIVLTTMVTNAVRLGWSRRYRGPTDNSLPIPLATKIRRGDGLISIEFEDFDKEKPPAMGELGYAHRSPSPFDFERLTRFMAYGFFMAPIQFQWFGFLSRAFPLTKKNPTAPVFKRVAFDQFIFAPFGLACFFTYMTIAEGGGKRALTQKFRDVYLPTLKANFVLWPAVQILNFRVIPIQFQIPFVSCIGIAWTAYLSLTNSSEES